MMFYTFIGVAFLGAVLSMLAAAEGRLPGDDFSPMIKFAGAVAVMAGGFIGALATAPDIGHGLPTLVLAVIAAVAVSGYIGGADD